MVALISLFAVALAVAVPAAHAAYTVTTVTLNGAATATVAPNGSVTIAVTVTTTSSDDWESTSYRIGSSGSYTCVNTDDNTSSGTNTESFTVDAPATPGTYNVEVRVHGSNFSTDNTCSGSADANKILTNALTVAADTTSPSVTINQAAAQVDPASASPINFTVVFSEPVSNFATGDVTLSGTAGATTATVTGSGTTYNVAVSGMTTSGTVIASIGAGKATDAAGNPNTASTATDNTVTYAAAPVCSAYTPVAGNVVPNPSFETGFTQGTVPSNTTNHSWTTDSFGTSNATFSIIPGHTGCNAAQISVSTYSGSQDNKWVFSSLPVTPGQYYTFTFWYKASTSTEADIFFTGSPSFQWLSNLPATADWTKFETSFLVPTGVTALTIGHTLVGAGTIASDDYSLVLGTAPVFASGMVSLTFDDGWKSIYTNAIPKLEAAGLKSTQFITTDPVITNHAAYNNSDGTNDFMVLADLLDMQSKGHEIAAHTKHHCDLVQMTPSSTECPAPATLTDEIAGARTVLINAGITTVDTMAYPYGQYNDAVVAAVQAAGYIAARSVDQGYNFTNTDKFKLKIQHVRNTTTVGEVQGWIDYALANKLWLILMFHRVENSSADCVTDADGDPLTPDVADADCTTTAVAEGIANYLATKPAGTTRTVHQVLTNADTVAPVLTVPTSPLYVVATSSTSIMAEVTYSVSATDNTNPNPTVICNPASGSMFLLGSTTVSCAAGDGTSTTTASFEVGVSAPAAPNGSPTATAQSISLEKNTSKAIVLAGTDPENNSLTYATTSNPAHGSLSGSGASLTYTPDNNYVGSDSFEFVVHDGTSTSSSATISITVTEPAPAPAPAPAPVSSGGGGGSGGGGVVLGLIGQVTQNNQGGLVLGASTQVLTDAQINAILDLLRSFNADQSVIDNVNKALRGQSTGATSGFVFSKTLQQGSTGSEVTELQKVLASLGFYSGPVTGYFGPLTKAAVIKFQAAKGLAQVGIVGPQTRAALNAR